jgi:hypothetical protein
MKSLTLFSLHLHASATTIINYHFENPFVDIFGALNFDYSTISFLLQQIFIKTLTGRKHQVRVHCASLGHPILLDPLYPSSNVDQKSKSSDKGQKKRHKSSPTPTNEMDDTVLAKAVSDLLLDNSQHQQERFFLHAASISVKELGISVNALLPRWWVEVTSQFT